MPKSIPPENKEEQREPSAASEASAPEVEYTLLVQRQDALERPETRRIDTLRVSADPKASVLAALEIARNAGAGDQAAGSVAWEGDCHEGICGGCSMLVNGRVALACHTRLEEASDKQHRIRLAPMKSFPLVRDLIVDRSRIERTLTSLPVAGPASAEAEVVERTPSATEAMRLGELDRCHRCGACLEACPQYGVHAEFVGALTLHEVHVRNSSPIGEREKPLRLEAMMAPGGVQSCGKAQNCVEVCPAQLPLVDSIQSVARATSKHLLFGWLLG